MGRVDMMDAGQFITAQFCHFVSRSWKVGELFQPKSPLYPRLCRHPYIPDSAGPAGQCSWMGRVDMMDARQGRMDGLD